MANRRYSKRNKGAFGADRTSSRGRTRKKKSQQQDSQIAWLRVGSKKISTDDIISLIIKSGGESSAQEILGGLGLTRGHRKTIHALLQEMCSENLLSINEDKFYRVRENASYMNATLSVNPRGFAFAMLTPVPEQWKYKSEAFIGSGNTGSAMHGDTVLIKIIGHREDRAEAKVVAVIERAAASIVGIFQTKDQVNLVIPEDERYPFDIRVGEENCGAENGDAVVAVITEHDPGKLGRPKGKVIELLGNPDSLKVQTEMVVRKFELPHVFSKQTKEQLRLIDDSVKPEENRRDLREILHITIDGETARDFDDAVAVEKTETGYRLHVSIADVSYYVTPGSPLDQDAYSRGTSVYFPTRVLPMLPERLSNDLCSLVPNQDRYAFTAILDFDNTGTLQKKYFTKSIINSRYRMTYNLVTAILIDKDADTRKKYEPLTTPLKWMEELGRALLKQRMSRGSIGFELPESFVEVDDQTDQVIGISRRDRTFAHQIIEEFMLAANEAVAKTLADNKLSTGLFRVHEAPDKLKVAEFKTFAGTMGIKLPKGDSSPQWFGQILKLVAGLPQEYIFNNLLLRTMKQAHYSFENAGHFGLAASHYCHFTSPIRRYPDLMVHRALAAFADKAAAKAKKEKKGAKKEVYADAGEFLSKRERTAVDAEREMVDRLKVRYMENKVGETFAGIISGVTSFGLFVELLDSFISGAVPITALKDDYYIVDDKNHRLIGKRLHKVYQIGGLVTVKVTSVEKSRRRINFEFVES